MYDDIKNIIEYQDFKLEELLRKIDVIWIKSELTDEQRDELIQLARDKEKIDNSINVLEKLKEIDKKIIDLEKHIYKLENGEEENPVEEYPSFKEGEWYYNGDKCSENGKNYICIAPEGQVCVWSPSKYPAYWEEVVESEG